MTEGLITPRGWRDRILDRFVSFTFLAAVFLGIAVALFVVSSLSDENRRTLTYLFGVVSLSILFARVADLKAANTRIELVIEAGDRCRHLLHHDGYGPLVRTAIVSELDRWDRALADAPEKGEHEAFSAGGALLYPTKADIWNELNEIRTPLT